MFRFLFKLCRTFYDLRKAYRRTEAARRFRMLCTSNVQDYIEYKWIIWKKMLKRTAQANAPGNNSHYICNSELSRIAYLLNADVGFC